MFIMRLFNQLFKFHEISPFSPNEFLVQQLDNGAIHEWDMGDTYKLQKYFIFSNYLKFQYRKYKI
jgi:hypothetical protein